MHDIINNMTDDMSALKTPFESFPLDSLMVNETDFLIYNDDALFIMMMHYHVWNACLMTALIAL